MGRDRQARNCFEVITMDSMIDDIVGYYGFEFDIRRVDGERNKHAVFMTLPDGASCQLTPPMKHLEAGVFLFGIMLAYQVGKAETFANEAFLKHDSKKAVDFLFFNELKFNLQEMNHIEVMHELKEPFLRNTINVVGHFLDKLEDSLDIELAEEKEHH